MNKTTVLIPNYNGIKYIEDCLRSIGEYPVIVVDNGSCDGSVELIADKFPNVKLIRLPENTGFCHAVNVGLKEVKTDFVFLLNNDTVTAPDTIDMLERRIMTDKSYFSVQSKILNMKQPELIDDCGDLYCALGWAYSRGSGKRADSGFDTPEEVFACCGAAVLYRMSVFDEIGMFDENHFAYLEDIDIGYRARIHGFKNVFEPKSVIFHAGSATSGSKHNRFKVNLSSQNSIYLIYKNMPLLQIVLNLPLLIIGFAIKTLFFCLKGMGFTYVRGLGRGFAKCAADMRDGHRNKVWFRPNYIPAYCRIQLELWMNIFKRL